MRIDEMRTTGTAAQGGLRRVRMLLALVASALLAVGITPASAHASEAATYKYKNVSRSICPDIVSGCTPAEISLSAQVKYNGSKVYVSSGPQCSVHHSAFVTVKITWCGVSNNGGADTGKLSIGVNFSVDGSFMGQTFHNEYWSRIDVSRTGAVSYQGCHRSC